MLSPFGGQVTFWVIFTDDLEHQVDAGSVALLAPQAIGAAELHDIRRAELTRSEAQTQGCEADGAAELLYDG